MRPQFGKHGKCAKKEGGQFKRSGQRCSRCLKVFSSGLQLISQPPPSKKNHTVLSQSIRSIELDFARAPSQLLRERKKSVSQNTITDWGRMSFRQLSSKLQKEGGKKKKKKQPNQLLLLLCRSLVSILSCSVIFKKDSSKSLFFFSSFAGMTLVQLRHYSGITSED